MCLAEQYKACFVPSNDGVRLVVESDNITYDNIVYKKSESGSTEFIRGSITKEEDKFLIVIATAKGLITFCGESIEFLESNISECVRIAKTEIEFVEQLTARKNKPTPPKDNSDEDDDKNPFDPPSPKRVRVTGDESEQSSLTFDHSKSGLEIICYEVEASKIYHSPSHSGYSQPCVLKQFKTLEEAVKVYNEAIHDHEMQVAELVIRMDESYPDTLSDFTITSMFWVKLAHWVREKHKTEHYMTFQRQWKENRDLGNDSLVVTSSPEQSLSTPDHSKSELKFLYFQVQASKQYHSPRHVWCMRPYIAKRFTTLKEALKVYNEAIHDSETQYVLLTLAMDESYPSTTNNKRITSTFFAQLAHWVREKRQTEHYMLFQRQWKENEDRDKNKTQFC